MGAGLGNDAKSSVSSRLSASLATFLSCDEYRSTSELIAVSRYKSTSAINVNVINAATYLIWWRLCGPVAEEGDRARDGEDPIEREKIDARARVQLRADTID